MKIIISPETDDEKKTFGEEKVFGNVFEFAFVGRLLAGGFTEQRFSHVHIADNFSLRGQLFELLERLRGHGTDSLRTN